MIVIAVLGLLAAIAVPNYMRFSAKSRQAEARVSLGSIYVSETAYFSELAQFGTFQQIGYATQGTNRYAYRIGAGATVGVDLYLPAPGAGADPRDNTVVNAGITSPPSPGFTATATANLDADSTVDRWHVNDRKAGLQTADSDDAGL